MEADDSCIQHFAPYSFISFKICTIIIQDLLHDHMGHHKGNKNKNISLLSRGQPRNYATAI